MKGTLRSIFRSTFPAAFALIAGQITAQCPNNNTLTGAAVTPPCPGSMTVPCVQGGQYVLVNVVAGNTYTFSTCGTSFDTEITLYNNTGGPSLGYNDDDLTFTCGLLSLQSLVTWTATFTGQLRVLVDLYMCASNAVCGGLTIQCSSPPPPLTNDNPCIATAVPVNASCVMQTFSNAGATATAGVPAPSCGLYVGGDVWFTFTAPASGIVTIETSAGTLADATFALYTAASCAGPFTEVACDDDSGPGNMPYVTLSGLTPGQTYYLRVFGYLGATGTFNLCLHTVTMPAGDCVYILEMFDSFGDGWDGSTVGISINGSPFVNHTITGAYDFALIGLNIGDVLVVQYTGLSPFPGEISYSLGFLGGSGVFNSGSPPATGVVFTQTIDCNPPPSPPEDCLGAITICSGVAFNNNTSTTGNEVDLNAANYGCLATAERQGTWYTWSPSTGGQVGFNIAPVGPDDYDFAIWGPYPAGSTPGVICPPAGPPIRCSFASGPSTFAQTGSYVTGTGSPVYSPPQWANPLPAYSENPAGDGWVSGINVTAGQVYLMYISNWDQTGLAFNLSWNLAGGASLDCTVLPMELVVFEADAVDDHVLLHWSTASEIMSDHFVIERSLTGDLFEPIGTIDAAGNSAQHIDYFFTDGVPRQGMNYYRLQQVDIDGQVDQSPTVGVLFHVSGPYVSDPYPVPTEGDIAIDLGGDLPGPVRLRAFDPTGRVVHERTLETGGGTLVTVVIPSLAWQPGIYALEVRGPDGCLLKLARWVKQ